MRQLKAVLFSASSLRRFFPFRSSVEIFNIDNIPDETYIASAHTRALARSMSQRAAEFVRSFAPIRRPTDKRFSLRGILVPMQRTFADNVRMGDSAARTQGGGVHG